MDESNLTIRSHCPPSRLIVHRGQEEHTIVIRVTMQFRTRQPLITQILHNYSQKIWINYMETSVKLYHQTRDGDKGTTQSKRKSLRVNGQANGSQVKSRRFKWEVQVQSLRQNCKCRTSPTAHRQWRQWWNVCDWNAKVSQLGHLNNSQPGVRSSPGQK